ncbi:MAG: hypothetical protein CME40_10885 [Haliea sp.]|nr:hypothetical protein [Haliea sp.]
MGSSATETTLTMLLMAMALCLLVVLLLYRRQRKLTELLRQESRTDHLTAIPNRRCFFEVLDNAVAVASRYQQPLSVLAMDIDHFKRVNDRYGHGGGDRVLVRVAGVLRDELRKADLVGRLGGEEFGVLLPMTPLPAAEAIAERLRQTVERLEFGGMYPGLGVTCSIGVAEHRAGDGGDALLLAADQALYQAKSEGRNRVCVAARPVLEDDAA